jgi:site-specific recombinase XerC
MLHLCFAAGLRVSELVGLQLCDVTLRPQASILVHGKGRRERCLPLWKITTAALRAWLGLRGTVPTPEVFVSGREALESMIAPKLRSGRFKATDKLIASLTSRSVMRRTTP